MGGKVPHPFFFFFSQVSHGANSALFSWSFFFVKSQTRCVDSGLSRSHAEAVIANDPDLQERIRMLEACLRVRSASPCQVQPSQVSEKDDEKVLPLAQVQRCESDSGFVHIDAEVVVAAPLLALSLPFVDGLGVELSDAAPHLVRRLPCVDELDDHDDVVHYRDLKDGIEGARSGMSATAGDSGETIRLSEVIGSDFHSRSSDVTNSSILVLAAPASAAIALTHFSHSVRALALSGPTVADARATAFTFKMHLIQQPVVVRVPRAGRVPKAGFPVRPKICVFSQRWRQE